MTPLTDDELGALLSDTFTAHEHLADPDRAVELAARPEARRSRRGPVLLAAAASVALVVGGTSYLVSQRGGSPGDTADGPSRTISPTPSETPIELAHVTRADARKAAEKAIAEVAVFPGATPSNAAGVPELKGATASSSPAGYTITRSRWWTVAGTTPKAVAHWYAAHPTKGFVSDGGLGSTSGTGDPTIEFISFHTLGSAAEVVSPVGVRIILETTTTAAGVGVRATVDSVWSPHRPAASYAKGVTSIDVHLTTTRMGHAVHSSHHTWSITDPARIARVVQAFNALTGTPPLVLNCPLILHEVAYRVVFHSPGGGLVAQVNASSCGAGVTVSRGGTQLSPALGQPTPLVDALRHSH